MFRLTREPTTLICYRSGADGVLTRGSHVGTKRAAIERAVGTALKNQYYHAEFIRSVVNLSSGKEKERLFRETIAWTTTLIECCLTLDKSAPCNDPGDEGSDWGIRTLREENDRRAAFMRNKLSRALSGRGQYGMTEYVHLLKYINQAEDYGSHSYVIGDPSLARILRRLDLMIFIKLGSLDDATFDGLDQAREQHGYTHMPLLVLEYEEAICRNMRNPRMRGEITKVMPFGDAAVQWIRNLFAT